jgi:hypothetical protein
MGSIIQLVLIGLSALTNGFVVGAYGYAAEALYMCNHDT